MYIAFPHPVSASHENLPQPPPCPAPGPAGNVPRPPGPLPRSAGAAGLRVDRTAAPPARCAGSPDRGRRHAGRRHRPRAQRALHAVPGQRLGRVGGHGPGERAARRPALGVAAGQPARFPHRRAAAQLRGAPGPVRVRLGLAADGGYLGRGARWRGLRAGRRARGAGRCTLSVRPHPPAGPPRRAGFSGRLLFPEQRRDHGTGLARRRPTARGGAGRGLPPRQWHTDHLLRTRRRVHGLDPRRPGHRVPLLPRPRGRARRRGR
ncbi:hypothetical protein FQZ97_690770 [compost metagenome]